MKAGIKCFIVLAVALLASSCASASDTTTKFQTGPFTGSFDLGVPCNDINISKPVQEELLSEDSYTHYGLKACRVFIDFNRYDVPTFNLNENMGAVQQIIVQKGLLDMGADKDTISVFERKIDGKPGAVGSGYMAKGDIKFYLASFDLSPKTVAHIALWGNESKMISVLKTIHITEAP